MKTIDERLEELTKKISSAIHLMIPIISLMERFSSLLD